MRAERFMFFGKFYQQAKKMPDNERLAFYDAIFAYGFEGEVKDLSPYPRADVAMVNVIDLVDDSVNRCNKGKESVMKRWKNTNDRSDEIPIIGDSGTLPYEEKRREEKRSEEEEKGSEEEEKGSEDISPPADTHLEERKEIVSYFNEKAKTNYKYASNKTRDLINARLNDGFTVEDFKTVIDKKCRSWLNDKKMQYYLRPETLFAAGHFESYLNEIQPEPAVINPEGFEELWDSMTSS